MRLFVSVELPEEIKRSLSSIQDRLRPLIKARWTAPEQFHLTLKFLGETPDSQLPQITGALGGVQFNDPITLHTSRIVCFPPHGPIRIIAAEMADESGACSVLQSGIDQACNRAGFQLEARRWTPHVTVGRVKDRAPGSLRAAAASSSLPRMDFEVEEFHLMESCLDLTGPTYLSLATFVSAAHRSP
jgi:2'-5' RNA ligase